MAQHGPRSAQRRRYSETQRLSTIEDNESSSDELPPAPTTVPRPPRVPAPMLGTVTPQDSLRSIKAGRGAANSREAKLFAAAGLDLFRQGLAFDGVQPQRHAPRHPAVTPSLHFIPEDDSSAAVLSSETQAILVFGAGSVLASGEVNACVANRVEFASQLYWRITKVFAEQQANSHCYLVPVADESGGDSVRENEAIRYALTTAGISPHHIVMDCSAASVIDNTVLLIPVLRHLHVETVHSVTSAFQLPRVRSCVDGILRAVPDMTFTTRYHVAPDSFRGAERTQRETLERVTMQRTRQALDDAIQRQQPTLKGSSDRATDNVSKGRANEQRDVLVRSAGVC